MRNQQQTKWNNYDCAGKFATLQLSRIQSLAAIQPTFDAKGSNAASLNAAQRYSGPLLKVDNRFRMQLYLDLTELNAGRLATLAATSEIEIEIVNQSLKRIQAWVPCEKIEALAALDFVARIRVP